MMKSNALIINVALTGHVPTKEQTPHVPITPEEIADDAENVYALGASIVHVHARDRSGRPTRDETVYADIIRRIRDRCPDLVVVASTSARDTDDLEGRMRVLSLDGDVKPDMASLTLGSLNFMKGCSVTPPEAIRRLVATMLKNGIMPELEVFDIGMANYAQYLIDHMKLPAPLYANLILGSLGSLPSTPANLVHLVNELPEEIVWGATGIGRFAFTTQRLAMAMGGHVRVGIEDSIYMDGEKTRPATNEQLVERVRRLADAMDREIASPSEVRALLNLTT